MGRRVINFAYVLGGIVLVFLSSRLLLRHQYVFPYHKGFSDNPSRWVPTFVPFFIGIWVFYWGLVGLISERRRKRPKSVQMNSSERGN